MEFWVGLILLTLIVLSTTANWALRDYSRVEISERLERRGKTNWLNRLTLYRDELLHTSSFVRMGSILVLAFLLARLFGVRPDSQPQFAYIAISISFMLLVMVFGVAIPHAWARYRGDAFLAAGLPVLWGMRYLLYPLLMFLRLFDEVVRRLAGVTTPDPENADVEQIERDILDVVSEGEMSGAVNEEDAEMIQSVIHLRETQAGEIMTPRTEMVALPETTTLIEAKETITRTGHSRIPIYGENIDEIKGVLYAKDLLNLDEGDPFDPMDCMRKVPFVPVTKSVPDLLKELREKKVQLAVVLDEYGGTAGLVTIEDIMEEIVGEISDEYETPEPASMRRIDPQTLEVDARVHIDELNDELDINLPEDPNYDTVGGFIFSEMGKIPAAGEELRYQNVVFRVLDAEERKINRLRVQVVESEPSATA